MSKKLNYEDVKKFIEIESKSECQLVSGIYINNKIPLKIKCRCGEIFDVQYNHFVSRKKRQCNKCGYENISKTNRYSKDFYINEVKKINDNIKLEQISNKNGRTLLKFKCSCGLFFTTDIYHFKKGKWKCDKCTRKNMKRVMAKKKTIYNFKIVKEFIESNGAKLLSKEYMSSHAKLKVQCSCGEIFEETFSKIKHRKKFKCNRCSRENQNKTPQEEIISFIENNSECRFISGTYRDVRSKLKLKCNCGNTFKVMFKEFKYQNYKKCDECRNDDFLKRIGYYEAISQLEKYGCKILNKYNKYNDKVLIQCHCGNNFNVYLRQIKDGKLQCNNCSSNSKGNDKIYKLLNKDYNIKFSIEKIFNGCKNIRFLPFDFEISNKLMVEYDGEQHFKPVEYFGGINSFEYRKHNDKIKNQYCIDNNIPLFRIPYWEFDNIKYILNSVLQHYNLIEYNDTYDETVIHKWLVDEQWDQDEYIALAPCNQNKAS